MVFVPYLTYLTTLVTQTVYQVKLISKFHESPWSGHEGTRATFEKLKEKYWWPGMYKGVHHFVSTCERCQMYSVVRLRDELQVDGRLGNNADWSRPDAIPSSSKGRPDGLGGALSADKQDCYPDKGSVRVR